jgi:II/X family phage/plasmid replication protein
LTSSPFLIDWLTLRLPLEKIQDEALHRRVRDSFNTLHCTDVDGCLVWEKQVLNVDALRSDSVGLFWQLQSDGKRQYLVIGGSPASLEHGLNVFGELDIQYCAAVLIRAACKELQAILPPFESWQCRRIDITGNYALPDAASVKQALRQLSISEGGRRKASNDHRGGDSVYWNPTSDLVKGKAYHKGPQLRRLVRMGKLECSEEKLALADGLLRFEHTRGARWFRRLSAQGMCWYDLTSRQLIDFFTEFFGRLVDGVEVNEMERLELVQRIKLENGCSDGQAEATFATYRNIRADGFDVARDYISRATWYRHLKMLRKVGISDADLVAGNVVQFRPVRVVLAQAVGSWDELRRAA